MKNSCLNYIKIYYFPRNDKNSLSKKMCIKKIKTKSDHSSLAMPRSRNLIWPYPTCSLSASLNYIRSHNLHVPQNGMIQPYTNGYMITETRNLRINIMNTNCFFVRHNKCSIISYYVYNNCWTIWIADHTVSLILDELFFCLMLHLFLCLAFAYLSLR